LPKIKDRFVKAFEVRESGYFDHHNWRKPRELWASCNHEHTVEPIITSINRVGKQSKRKCNTTTGRIEVEGLMIWKDEGVVRYQLF